MIPSYLYYSGMNKTIYPDMVVWLDLSSMTFTVSLLLDLIYLVAVLYSAGVEIRAIQACAAVMNDLTHKLPRLPMRVHVKEIRFHILKPCSFRSS